MAEAKKRKTDPQSVFKNLWSQSKGLHLEGIQNLLQRNCVTIVENIDLDDGLLIHLYSKEVINDRQKGSIKSKPTSYDKNEELLDILRRKPKKDIQVFLKAISEGYPRRHQNTMEPYPLQHPQQFYQIGNHPFPPPGDYRPWQQHSQHQGYQQLQGYLQPPYQQLQVNQLPSGYQQPPEQFLPINIQDVTEMEVASKHREVAGCYNLKRNPRGRCVIINNVNFYTLKDRKGSDLDASNLEQLFKRLHFVVDIWTNLTGEEARDNISKESKNSAHEKADAFVFIVLSHGTIGNITAVNGEKLNIEDDIVKSFSGKSCPALAGKPKIFLIQACQGVLDTTGVPEADDGGPNASALSETIEESDAGTVISNNLVHEMGDTVIAYSTVPGFRSWRVPDLGSWFMREFVITCCEVAHTSHLHDILTAVSGRVSKKQVQFEGFKQIARIDSRMPKNFYFFPGYFRS